MARQRPTTQHRHTKQGQDPDTGMGRRTGDRKYSAEELGKATTTLAQRSLTYLQYAVNLKIENRTASGRVRTDHLDIVLPWNKHVRSPLKAAQLG
ncbi:hypothetical protein MferCBS31731_001008 [Microsporum ferrugineum]